jgi:cytochrome c oxidase cbb3-type subunit 3
MAVLIVGFPLYRVREPSLRKDAMHSQQVTYARIGTSLFSQNCASCHGKSGTGGGGAPTLNSHQFLGSTSDAQIGLLVSGGVSGTAMPAWSSDFSGPLTNEQIQEIVAYLRSLAPKAPSIPNWRAGASAP